MIKNNFIKIIIFTWLGIWFFFVARELFYKRSFYVFAELLKRDEAGRRSYVYGDDLYEFLEFSRKKLPRSATYRFISPERDSIEYRRAVYYLYPLLQSSDARFILVYNRQGYSPPNFEPFAYLDNKRFILRRK